MNYSNMNNNYYLSPATEYTMAYDYSFQYSSPTSSTYLYMPTCPVHSSPSYMYYQQNQTSPIQFCSTPVEEQNTRVTNIDHTPLRRHKCFKKNELQILYQAYVRDPHPSIDTLQQLANQLNASIEKVRQWFKNRRHSDKQKQRSARSSKI